MIQNTSICNANDNIKVETLDDKLNDELTTSQCPISILPPEPSDIPQETYPTDKTIVAHGEDPIVNVPIDEIVNSSDEAARNHQPSVD